MPAARLGREQAAQTGGHDPVTLRRRPGRIEDSSAEILERMTQMGW
jgi:hypothetical protein